MHFRMIRNTVVWIYVEEKEFDSGDHFVNEDADAELQYYNFS